MDKGGFNRWAGEYDQSIDPGDREYPFAGYYDVLSLVQDLVLSDGRPSVLDLGVGTGLPLARQAAFMVRLARENLNPGGSLIVADVAFATWEELWACRAGAGKYWDEEEAYLVLEAVCPALTEAGLGFRYTQVSHCGGVLQVLT